MEHINRKKYFLHKWTNIINILGITFFMIFLILGFQKGIFTNKTCMENFLKSKKAIAPLLFIIVQIVQVIFPIIPGGATSLLGVLLFGPILGFIYNYIGMVTGSVLAFHLSKKYSYKIINLLFKEKSINKYKNKLEKKNFKTFFMWAIILPGAPDDLLCYLIGLTSIRTDTFLKIILLGKPISLLGYSFFIKILPL